MRTTLTIDCDIRDAQAILYEASKIIDKRNEYHPAKFKVKCHKCSWVGVCSCNTRCPNCREMIKASDIIGGFNQIPIWKPEPSIKYDDRKEWSEAGYLPDLKEVVPEHKPILPVYVMCPVCDWTGRAGKLRVNGDMKVMCPKCSGIITTNNIKEGAK